MHSHIGVVECECHFECTAGKNFTEGWVEFEDKAIAKSIAQGLNGQQIGGKRRSAYHYDLWNMKYLPKFKWDHLTEEIAYEKVGGWHCGGVRRGTRGEGRLALASL
jgi:hypothetical protein